MKKEQRKIRSCRRYIHKILSCGQIFGCNSASMANDKTKLQIVMIVIVGCLALAPEPNADFIPFRLFDVALMTKYAHSIHSKRHRSMFNRLVTAPKKKQQHIVHAQHLHYIVRIHNAPFDGVCICLFFFLIYLFLCRCRFFFCCFFARLNYYAFTFNNTFAMCCQATRH